jgi:alkanesulfonate monooxygenase SsuD/methylene tetrahydromethanopterin reductase-like flavin-dependent oxidoreductase (luciferase family)
VESCDVEDIFDHPGHRFNDLEFWLELAQLLEYGTFDAVFLPDVIGAYDGFRGQPGDRAHRVQMPNNDPLLLIPAMATVTKGLGFAATFSSLRTTVRLRPPHVHFGQYHQGPGRKGPGTTTR